ncbi:MAG: hypothetical protein FWB76_05510 [Oscillospiraceae bacterium]|nr:hypothetical protein [Oscillospiraceae bacterium]
MDSGKLKRILQRMDNDRLNSIQQRNELDTEFYRDAMFLLKARYETKEHQKRILAYVLIAIIFFVSVGAGIIIWFLAQYPSEHTVALVAAIGGLVSTLLGLPLILAKYLFDKDEDKFIFQQLKHIRSLDSEYLKRVQEKEIQQDIEELDNHDINDTTSDSQ